MKRFLLGNLALAIALTFVLGFTTDAQAGGKAPDFSLKDTSGNTVNLSDFLGEKVIIISFWATWCTPCKAEMPHLEAMYKELGKDGLVVLSISVDEAKNEPQVKNQTRAGGYTFPVLLDQSTEVVTLFNSRKSVPYAVVIGKDKNIHSTHEGYSPGDEEALKAEVMQLLGLAEGGTSGE